jgi:transposase InsO family protein
MLDVAVDSGARLFKACEVIGLSIRSVQRYRLPDEVEPDGRKAGAIGRIPTNKISDKERTEVLAIANMVKFANLPPSQIVPALADEGRYVASESTFYRVLRSEDQLAHRGRSKAPAAHSCTEPLEAVRPNQLWSWDITYLQTTVKGLFFYLYMILDVYSRKIVGWEVYEEESATYAAKTALKAYLREGIGSKGLILHSDNGSPMKGSTMLAMLQTLGIMPSFSRPSISNDNPYSEALFKTVKYDVDFPEQPFETIEETRVWVAKFVPWYNEEHHHSALKFVTPGQRHRGEDIEILTKRELVYETAKALHPERWAGTCRNWKRPEVVTLKNVRNVKELEKTMMKKTG